MSLTKIVLISLVAACIIVPHSGIPIIIALGVVVCVWAWVSAEFEKLMSRSSEKRASAQAEENE